MMVRALICCAALILGLLATLGATAQSYAVCSGATCRTVEKARPLDLMAFMRGNAKTSAKPAAKSTGGKAGKHRHGTSRPAARPDHAPDTATPEPAVLPAAAASAYAAHADHDVQVVTSDQLNAIDVAMLRSTPETDGAARQADTDVGVQIAAADASQARDAVFNPNSTAASPAAKPQSHGNEAVRDDARDDSWMSRLWSAVGDGFVALVAMVRQLFG